MTLHELEYSYAASLYDANIQPRIHLLPSDNTLECFSADEYFKLGELTENKTVVLGFDIYHYSMFEKTTQLFIPMLFELIYQDSWNLVKKNYSYVFQEYDNFGNESSIPQPPFISTGDGGFLIIDSPIHAILFLATFSTLLRLYNSGLYLPKLHQDTDNIEIRYALTIDNVYKYKENYYGNGIINNARILSKDKLNRFLIDNNVYKWFLNNMAGIENLVTCDLLALSKIPLFSSYDNSRMKNGYNSLIPESYGTIKSEGFKAVDVLKIGTIKEKNTELNIYNIHIQIIINYKSFFDNERIFSLSIGNLNISGIE